MHKDREQASQGSCKFQGRNLYRHQKCGKSYAQACGGVCPLKIILEVASSVANGKDFSMKSAYELAMERLEKQSPTAKVTDEQRREIAEIDSTYKAKIAEREVFLKDQILKATAAGDPAEIEALERQLASELRRLNEDCEDKKEKVRSRA